MPIDINGNSELADANWLPTDQASKAVLFCIRQDPDTIIPMMRIYHRAQIQEQNAAFAAAFSYFYMK